MSKESFWVKEFLIFSSFSRKRIKRFIYMYDEIAKKSNINIRLKVKYKIEEGAIRRDLYCRSDIRKDYKKKLFRIIF